MADAENVTSIDAKQRQQAERAAFRVDMQKSAERDWEKHEMPSWGGRTVWICSLTAGERGPIMRKGYEQYQGPDGEIYQRALTEVLHPELLARTVHHEVDGQKVPLFERTHEGGPTRDEAVFINSLKGPDVDRLVASALKLIGLGREAREDVKKPSPEPEETTSDSGSSSPES